MKDVIASGRLGRLILGDAIVKWYRTQQYYDRATGAGPGRWTVVAA